MSGMTSYLQQALLDHVLGNSIYTAPAGVWLSLHVADPTDTGSHANEISSGGYARQPLSAILTAADPSSGISTNTTATNVGPATVDWGTVSYGAIEDAVTSGNMLLSNALTTAQVINNGEEFQLAPTQLQLQFA